MNTIFIVLPILTLLMFDLGLSLKPQDFKLILSRPKPVIAGLVGQIILLPLLAWGVGNLFHLAPVFFVGVMLVACSPGGSSSNVFSMLAKGDVALSVTLTACSSIITLFTLPLIMAWVTQCVGDTSTLISGESMAAADSTALHFQLPVGNLLMQNIVLMAVPIALGLAISVYKPQTAEKWHNILKRIALPALVLLVTIFFLQHRETIVREFPSLGLTMTLLILASTSCGALLARVISLTGRERRTLVIEIGMQNAAQAITIACSPLIFNNETMAIPAIIYALMMNIILLIYVAITTATR